MNRAYILFTVSLVMMVSAGWTLVSIKRHQRWSEPGVRLAVGSLVLPGGKVITTNIVALPSVSGYTSESLPLAPNEVDGLPSDTTFGRRYYRATNGFEAILSVVLMGSDRTSLHPPRYCIEGQGCAIDKTELITIPLDGPAHYEIPATKVSISRQFERNGQRLTAHGIYIYWYVSEAEIRPEYGTHLWSMLSSLFQKRTLDRWAYISCLSMCTPGEEAQTLDRMKELLGRSVPEFQLASKTLRGDSAQP